MPEGLAESTWSIGVSGCRAGVGGVGEAAGSVEMRALPLFQGIAGGVSPFIKTDDNSPDFGFFLFAHFQASWATGLEHMPT